MALHVEPALLERHGEFYRFALREEAPAGVCALFEHTSDAQLPDALGRVKDRENVAVVIVRDCPGLTDLSFLASFPSLEWAGLWRCPDVRRLWALSCTPALRGLAAWNCKRLTDISALAEAGCLAHLCLQNRAWDAVRLQGLEPLAGLSGLRTMDLAFRSAGGSARLDFRALYPELDALTITPGLSKFFVSNRRARR